MTPPAQGHRAACTASSKSDLIDEDENSDDESASSLDEERPLLRRNNRKAHPQPNRLWEMLLAATPFWPHCQIRPEGKGGQVQYSEAPHQSTLDVMAVLMRKHLILAWRRQRFTGVLLRAGVLTAMPLVVYFTSSGGSAWEETRKIYVSFIMPLIGTMVVLMIFTMFAIEVVTDKELKMRYVQQVAGVSNIAYWCSYYLYYFLLTSFALALHLGSLMWIAPYYRYSSGLLLFLSFTAAFTQSYFLSMMVATVLSRARMAGVVCSTMGAMPVLFFFTVLPLIKTKSIAVYLALSLIPFVSPTNLLNAICVLEAASTEEVLNSQSQSPLGFTLSNFFAPVSGHSTLGGGERFQPAAGVQLLILFVDCILYGLFAAWFDQVYQGEFGAAKPMTFCLDPAFLRPRRLERCDAGAGAHSPALELADLVKAFGTHRVVDGMSLEVRRAEIFALLGHNGAGKTTAINCITGMLPVTSGSIKVCGIDVATELQEARRHLSVCPQDNPLYVEFTVDEHLNFFAALRGIARDAVGEDINEALEALGLTEKRAAHVAVLSGGQKRRLWVATSLLGKTPVVFLDEPTSGMDPANRRKLWDLLVRMKASGRSILFTTHYLDEADVLAERKAVLHEGQVKAIGTSLELKREFGLGYHLRVVGSLGALPNARDGVAALVRSHIPLAQDERVSHEDHAQAKGTPSAWCFILPYSQVEQFGPMLSDLERRAAQLQATDFSLEATTLEEVFMSLGRSHRGANGTEGGEAVQVTHITVPDDHGSAQPSHIPRREKQSLVMANLPARAQVEQARGIYVPHATPDVELIRPNERVPVSWGTSMEAVLLLRWRQVLQKQRSLLATMVVPISFICLNAWTSATLLQKLQGLKKLGMGSIAMGMSGASSGMVMTISLAIALPYFATSLVTDRVQRCLYVATSQGLQCSAYWVGTFISNYLHFLVLACAAPVSLILFHTPFYSEMNTAIQYVPAALFCPVPMLLFAYSVSRLFSTTEACAKLMPAISLMAALVPFLAVYMLTLTSLTFQMTAALGSQNAALLDRGKSLGQWACIVHWAMSFLDPFYCLPGTFAAIGLTQLTDSMAQFEALGIEVNMRLPSLGGSYVAVPLLGAVSLSAALGLLLAWDTGRAYALLVRALGSPDRGETEATEEHELRRLLSPADRGNGGQREAYLEDLDVQEEKQRVASAERGSLSVMYKNLVHTYNPGSAQQVRAVRGISLGVSPGECFCLLGPNGAGKTTTLDVLTGAIFPPTRGEVYIGPHLATGSEHERHAAMRLLGNCPQVDPLWPTLSGRQHLVFYAKIKGLPPGMRSKQAAVILKSLGFSDFDADKPTAGYSGGMKRKLSLAIALIGSPPTLLLDEPSTAVDAAAKRHLWQVVKCRDPKQTVILTTHSMEEAEALSSRLAIQVCGRLRVLGTPDHVKMTHGAGYQLEMLTSSASTACVEGFVLGICPTARLLEAHEGRFVFQFPVLRAVDVGAGELSLATLFLKMQEATRIIGLRDYSISRPSLEQVFLRLSREQEDAGHRELEHRGP